MSSPSQPMAPLSAQSQVDAMQKQLAAQLVSLQRRNYWTAGIGVVLLLAVSSYFYYGYRLMSEVMEPKTLVDAGENVLMERLPKAREAVQVKIIAAAPEVAEMLSHSVLENMPDARISLESLIKDRTAQVLNETATLTDEQVKRFLNKNRKQLKENFQNLKNDKLKKEAREGMTKLAEEEFEQDFKEDAEGLFRNLKELNVKMKRMTADDRLDFTERKMRSILMICKRLIQDRKESE